MFTREYRLNTKFEVLWRRLRAYRLIYIQRAAYGAERTRPADRTNSHLRT